MARLLQTPSSCPPEFYARLGMVKIRSGHANGLAGALYLRMLPQGRPKS